MNKKLIEIKGATEKTLPILSDEDAKIKFNKGWTYSNIYSLRALRDVYLVLKYPFKKDLKTISIEVEKKVIPESKDWNERKVLEYLNALVNFQLVYQDYSIKSEVFINSVINSDISTSDTFVFKEIFFSYFRFKEISSWFINPSIEFHENYEVLNEIDFITQSKHLYFYKIENRFYNRLINNIESIKYIYKINDELSHLMRFCEVYIKWGTYLKIIDKFNLSLIDFKTDIDKNLTLVYFIKPFKKFDLVNYIANKPFKNRQISIPELIFKIVNDFSFSVESVKKFIINEIHSNDKLTFERTSEIFIIKGKNSIGNIKDATYLYPIINNNYISHLILRK
ncbi:hypothetical protein MC378_12105 [Polaribacter sp. MSW13]|uniref:Uncharacterized protein n=1 Tax=Polaribacter marinus TaxID=2916838 RepID=A0A9X1VPE6_9FLAO|nr:hypothetical protein [Polaribacter marinus]MCI2229911.1 hypothetical protein [Polaribacter marinus]